MKIEPSPILAPRIDKVFSPVCDCDSRVATIQFRLRKPDRVRLDFTTTGEKITLRSDGGEWLQPATKQLIRIPAENVTAIVLSNNSSVNAGAVARDLLAVYYGQPYTVPAVR